jgi:hypothetical protein
MKKSMEPLKAGTTSEGQILIEQEFHGSDESQGVIVDPSQVDLLIQWLQEAKAELQQSK